MIFNPNENIQVHFRNGRRTFIEKYSTSLREKLEKRFDSKVYKVSGATTIKFGNAWQKDHHNHNESEKHEVKPVDRKKPARNR